jgi:hypothetical protein
MIAETYILEMRSPGSDRWVDCGMNSKFNDLYEARKELEHTVKSYGHLYKFRINHITCEEHSILEMNGVQDILNS